MKNIDFKLKQIQRDREGHYILIKGKIQEDIVILNIYAPNKRHPNSKKKYHYRWKSHVDSGILTVGDINTPLQPIGHLNKS